MIAQPVGVLAVMRRDAEHAHEHRCDTPRLRDEAMARQHDSCEARAAVAELIEAAPIITDNEVTETGYGYLLIEMRMTREELDLYRAALARVGGVE